MKHEEWTVEECEKYKTGIETEWMSLVIQVIGSESCLKLSKFTEKHIKNIDSQDPIPKDLVDKIWK